MTPNSMATSARDLHPIALPNPPLCFQSRLQHELLEKVSSTPNNSTHQHYFSGRNSIISRGPHRHGLHWFLILSDISSFLLFILLFVLLGGNKSENNLKKQVCAFLMLFTHCIFRRLFFKGKMKCSIFYMKLLEISYHIYRAITLKSSL